MNPINWRDPPFDDGLRIIRTEDQQLGFTPREYINFHKVETSKTMLQKGMSVTDAAIDLGFSTPNYFSSVFKRFTTLSSSEYLKIPPPSENPE